MNRGFATHTHIVIYCHTCGDRHRDRRGGSSCFDSTEQARDYLSAVDNGWHLTASGQVECVNCRLAAECAIRGHEPTGDGACANCGHLLTPSDPVMPILPENRS